MLNPGDIVIFDFPGAMGIKRRPAVIVSSNLYHVQRPDVILGVLTTNLRASTTSTDYILQDWSSAGLYSPSASRAYFVMTIPASVRKNGQVPARDLDEIRARAKLAFA